MTPTATTKAPTSGGNGSKTAAPPPRKMPPIPPRGPTAPAPFAQAAVEIPELEMATPEMPPVRLVLNGVEGWGKTTLGALAPDPAMIMARGESGYLTLLGADRVPHVPSTTVERWPALLGLCDKLAADPKGRKTFVFDALGGFERLCHEHVCAQMAGKRVEDLTENDWGEKGFLSFHKGFEIAAGEWLKFLQRLDRLVTVAKANVVLLSHVRIEKVQNPMGPDYDRYGSNVHKKTWAATAAWADCVLFGTYSTTIIGGSVGDKARKGKASADSGTARIVHAERCDAWDAKNRYGCDPSFWMPYDPAQSWSAVWDQIAGQARGDDYAKKYFS